MPNCGCPDGYTLNTATGLCESVVQGAVSIGQARLEIPAICQNSDNMVNGTVFYPPINPNQFPLIGQSTSSTTFTDAFSTIIVPSATLLSGNLWISGGNSANGLLNQRGVGLPNPANTWYGVNRCVTVGVGDTTSFALSARTAFRLYINGVLAVIHQPTLPAKANQHLHIFTINLVPGSYTFRAEGLSSGSITCGGANSYGAFLVDVFKNITPALLASITTQLVLNGYYANTNAGYPTPALLPGLNFDVSSNPNSATFYCNSGYVNACSAGSFTCQITTTTPYIPCCFDLVECTTGVIIKTTVDLSAYLGHIVKIQEASGCYIISTTIETNCVGAIPVTVITFYEDCTTCNQIYYKLTDCNGVAVDVITSTNLSTSVGLIIKIQGYDDICWIVTVDVISPNVVTVIKTLEFATCQACQPPPPIPDPPFYQLSPLALKARSVQPGYEVGECSADFVEDINCNFATQVYARLNEQRYGVESCILDEYDKYFIKKQLLDLNLIYNPDFCKVLPCCPPECVISQIIIYDLVDNTVPFNLSTSFVESDQPAFPPENPEATITY